MKINIQTILSVLFVGALGLASCSTDYDTDFTDKELEVPHSSQQTIAFDKEGGTHDITVKTNVALDEWTATSNAIWLTVEKKSDGSGVTVTAPGYVGFKKRQAKVTIAHGDKSSYEIQVVQMGTQSVLTVPEQDPFFNRDGVYTAYLENSTTSLDIPVETNLNIDHIIVPDTVNFVHLDTTKTVKDNGTVKLHLDLDKNATSSDRYCTMQLQSSDDWDATINVLLVQSAKGLKVRGVYPSNTTDRVVSVNMLDLPRTYRVPFQRTSADGTYTITVPEDAKSWLTYDSKINKTSGSELRFTSKINSTDATRFADVVCTPSSGTAQSFTIHITQEAFQNINPTGVSNLSVTPGAGSFAIKWTAPDEVDYDKIIVTATSKLTGIPVSTKTLDNIATSCTLDDVYRFAGDYTITVTTEGLRGKKTQNVASKTAAVAREWTDNVEVPLKADMVTTNSFKAGHEVSCAVDGSKSTYFQTSTSGKTSDPHPYIEITLDEPITGTFFINFDERKVSSDDRNPKKAEIYGSANAFTSSDKALNTITYRSVNGVGEPLDNVTTTAKLTHLLFVPIQHKKGTNILNGGGTSYWYLAELHLYLVHNEAWKKAQLGIK